MSLGPLAPGRLFAGRYEVIRCVKIGGMGAVYEVTDAKTQRRRALKVMLPEIVSDRDKRERFEREATIAARIDSEHIVETFDAGIDDATATPFLVMELLRGQELGELIRARGRLTPEETVTLLAQAAFGLEKTHADGIVHRDLKPENLFVTRRDDGMLRLKILDFGIAKLVARSASVHHTKRIGTPLYMAPEQLTGDGRIGPAADLYALGHIAFTALVGRAYWEQEVERARGMHSLATQLLSGPEEPPTQRAARAGVRLPTAFDDWFARATAVEASDRFARAAEQIVALAEVLGLPAPSGLEALSGDDDPYATTQQSADDREPAHVSSSPPSESVDSFLREVARMSDVAPPGAEPDRTGETLAHFRITGKLGQGGMGVVYAAEDLRLRRKVALKVLPLAVVGQRERRRRFLREARSASAVMHPNLAAVFDVGEADGTIFIAMEHVEGETLRRVLERHGRIEVAESVRIARQAAAGLAKAHAAGVVHRDLKPENVMVAADGTVKVLDFGLAKIADAPEPNDGDSETIDELASRVGRILGTPGYMSPEQARGAPVDARTDVFSFGVVLYEMLTGTRPFRGATTVDLLAALERDDARPLRELAPVPAPLAALVHRCLAKDPDERPADGAELVAELAVDPKRKLPRAMLALLGAVGIAGLGLVAMQNPPAPTLGTVASAVTPAAPALSGVASAAAPPALAPVAASSSVVTKPAPSKPPRPKYGPLDTQR